VGDSADKKMKNIEIRHVTDASSDADRIALVWSKTNTYLDCGYHTDGMQHLSTRLNYVILADGEHVGGFGLVDENEHKDVPLGHIGVQWIWVNPDVQRRGVCSEAIRQIRDLHGDAITAVRPVSIPAQHVCRALGICIPE